MVRRGQQFVDEVFLRIHTSLPTELNLQTDLGLSQTPIHHAVLSWQGQIAPSYQHYRYSHTNTPSLLYQPTVMILQTDTHITLEQLTTELSPYLRSPISYSFLIYSRIDNPWLPNTHNTACFISQRNGYAVEFNTDSWLADSPLRNTPSTDHLPGYSSLIPIYSIDPSLPPTYNRNVRPRPSTIPHLTSLTSPTHLLPINRLHITPYRLPALTPALSLPATLSPLLLQPPSPLQLTHPTSLSLMHHYQPHLSSLRPVTQISPAHRKIGYDSWNRKFQT